MKSIIKFLRNLFGQQNETPLKVESCGCDECVCSNSTSYETKQELPPPPEEIIVPILIDKEASSFEAIVEQATKEKKKRKPSTKRKSKNDGKNSKSGDA